MIHWAWLILAFYVGAATMMLIGYWYDWLMGDTKPIEIKPLDDEPRGYVADPSDFLNCRSVYPKQPSDDTKPDLKHAPWVKCFHCGRDIFDRAVTIPPGDTYNHWRLLCPACFDRQPIDDGPQPNVPIKDDPFFKGEPNRIEGVG